MTLSMTLVGCVIGFGLACILVFLRQTPGLWAAPLRLVCIAYVETFRRIPFLVVIYLVLFFIQAFVSDASLFTVAVTAICLYAVAYTAEIIRGGLESVPRQQVEAAQTMNIGRLQTNLLVVLPQAWPVILPPAVAFGISFIKDTALVSQIGVFELTFRGKELNNQGFSGILVFGTIALGYFAISYPLSRLGQQREKRLETPRGQRRPRQLRQD
jgi:polar amino acid transport system permease protein